MKTNLPLQGIVAIVVVCLLAVTTARAQAAVSPAYERITAASIRISRDWTAAAFAKPGLAIASPGILQAGSGTPIPKNQSSSTRRLAAPFSFKYDGKSSDEFLDQWQFSTGEKSEGSEIVRVNTYKDPNTGLEIECQIKTFSDSPGIDWVFYLRNKGNSDTPIIEDFLPLDAMTLMGESESDPLMLRWSNGDIASVDSFLPHDELLPRGETRQFIGGFSSDTYLPFFNIQRKDVGWILAVGWTGSWMAEFSSSSTGAVGVRSGMARTHFRLHPGERIRTPRMVLMPWKAGEMIYGHNLFRRMMLDHYVQRRNGEPAVPPIGHPTTTAMRVTGVPTNEKNEVRIIEKAAKLGVELAWMDAFYLPQPWPAHLGDWEPRRDDFPNGLRPLADAAHENGMKFVVWFFGPVANTDSDAAKEHPDLLYGPYLIDGGSSYGLWKMDDPTSRVFIVNRITERLKEWDVDIYREDGEGEPAEGLLAKMESMEGEDRCGISQMKYFEGWYTFWEDLMARKPGLLIDNCSGGGNRIDIETCSRSYVLWRTDLEDSQHYSLGQTGWSEMGRTEQVLAGGLSLYFPLHSGVAMDMTPYGFRSSVAPGLVIHCDIEDKNFSEDMCRQGIMEAKSLRPLFLGDMYPLLNLTTNREDWYAYQLDRPDLGEGCVFVFRRTASKDTSCNVDLYEIDPNAIYNVSVTGETFTNGPWNTMRGSELAHHSIKISECPGSVLIRYKISVR